MALLLAAVGGPCLFSSAALGNHQVEFTGPTNFAAGNGPQSIAVGDFNGDLDPDLAVSNVFGESISILVGGAGASFAGAPSLPTGTGTFPQTVTVGEFNGDTDPDLAVANTVPSGNVKVFLGAAGATFTGPTSFAAGTDPRGIVAINVDPDDGVKDDLVVANATSLDVSVLLGDGSGGFSAPTAFPVNPGGPWTVAAAQINGGGDPDLVVGSSSGTGFSLLLGAAGGTFGAPAPISAQSAPVGVATGNFDGDADADIATANFGGNSSSVFLGDGTGAFSVPRHYDADVGPRSVAVGDFNSDAEPDLAIANATSNDLSVLVGVPGPSPTFNGPIHFAAGSAPFFVTTGDFDQDSDTDVAVANSGSDDVSVLLQTAAAGPGPPGPAGPPGAQGAQGPPGRDATVTCKAKGKKRIKCSVAFTASASAKRASARLTRDGVTYARGSSFVDEGRERVPLVAVREIPAGRYTLTLKVSYAKDKTAVTKRRVSIG